MSNTLVLNSNNVIGTNNSTFQYNFIQGAFRSKDCEMSIGSLTIPYSWYNVSSFYNNKTFSLTFPYLATTATLNIVLPDGFYTVSDINQYIELECINNGLYLVNAGQNVYFINLSTNITYYKNQFVFNLVPIALTGAYAGYTQPPTGYWSATAGNGLPTVSTTPFITLASVGSIGPIIGFTGGTYPSAGPYTVNASSLSNITPNATTVNGIVLRCNLVDNNIASPSDILDSFNINATFGANITYSPNFPKFIRLKDGTYNSMILTMVDQNLNSISAQDPNVLITLIVRKIGLPE